MPAIIERYDSRAAVVGTEDPSVELIYIVTGTENDADVHALVQATIPAVYNGLIFQRYKIQHQGAGIWEVVVTYGKFPSKEPGQSSWSFETGGGTQKITQSIANVGNYSATMRYPAPNYKGAINVTEDNVEGVEITVPQYQWSETHWRSSEFVTEQYKRTLFLLTGTVNMFPFRGFATGEVLFLGASGSKRGIEDWEITYKFAASLSRENIKIGDITVPFKEGWHYLWVRYVDKEDPESHRIVKYPASAHVEQVYHYANFALLGIGS